jgi:DegV family protein with EDD domain
MSTSIQVGVVTDSTADIPNELLETHAISMVPALLIINGQTFENGSQLSRSDFYKGLPDYPQPPTTATPSPALFESAYQCFFDLGIEQVLSIHVASTLSGMLTSANQAAQAFPRRVHVIDSGQLSLGLGFQVIEAAHAAQQGQSLDQVIQVVSRAQDRVRVVALINTLEYLRRSGRVNWLRAGMGELLRIKQLLGVSKGAIEDLGKTRTFERALQKLLDIGRSWGNCKRLAVLHTDAHDLADQIAVKIADQSVAQPLVVEVTTIIGAHIGPGSIGLAALTT